jgi:hypothetical protein
MRFTHLMKRPAIPMFGASSAIAFVIPAGPRRRAGLRLA